MPGVLPLIKINDGLVVNLFNITQVNRATDGMVVISFPDGSEATLDNPAEANAFMTFLNGVSERLEIPRDDRANEGSRDFTLGDETPEPTAEDYNAAASG